jgi:hypothetical protein
MHPDPHPHPSIRHHREWAAGLDPEADTPPHGTPVAQAPRGGTIGPPPALPNNAWQMLMQSIANAAQQLAQAATVRPIFLQLMNDPVQAQAFTAAFQSSLVAGTPSLALVGWPYTGTQGPSPTAPKTTA